MLPCRALYLALAGCVYSLALIPICAGTLTLNQLTINTSEVYAVAGMPIDEVCSTHGHNKLNRFSPSKPQIILCIVGPAPSCNLATSLHDF